MVTESESYRNFLEIMSHFKEKFRSKNVIYKE